MSVGSRQTRTRILACAGREFMEQGYQKANMRRIAQTAGVTTGAMYNHFANKEQLFDALVQAPAEDLLAQFQELHRQAIEGVAAHSAEGLGDQSRDGADWMLSFIYQYKDAFRLIFCCSEGTRWATYGEKLIEIEEQAHRIYFDRLSITGEPLDDFFLHITAATGFQHLVEIISHDLPYERAIVVMDNIKRYSMAGWNELLGLKL